MDALRTGRTTANRACRGRRILVYSSDGRQIRSRRLSAVHCDIVFDFLAFGEAAHARTFDSGDMNEHIVSAPIRLNEAEAFLRVKPFHCSGGHLDSYAAVARTAAS
jgi:hypothetical protein